jgi:hypothetical protein
VTSPPEIEIPARDWGDDEPAPPVTALVLVSSRDHVGDPGPEVVPNKTAPWRNLAVRASKAGWSVELTYALAWYPDQHHLNGKLRKAAHHVHTIALRCRRPDGFAFAVWSVEAHLPPVPGSGWSFSVGCIRGLFFGARAFTPRLLATS